MFTTSGINLQIIMNNLLKSKTRLTFIQIIFEHLSTKNDIFNISNHNMTTIKKMAQIISKLSNKKIIKYKSFLKGSPHIIKISNKKILRSINLRITTSLKDGLLNTYKWYLNLCS